MTRRITVHFKTGEEKILVINRFDGVRIKDGVAFFGRTDEDVWTELLAAPLASISYWA